MHFDYTTVVLKPQFFLNKKPVIIKFEYIENFTITFWLFGSFHIFYTFKFSQKQEFN